MVRAFCFLARCVVAKRTVLMGFKNYSERGAWVEMLFMAAAAYHGYRVLKPWGDVFPYDVAIEIEKGMLRVQVKSTTFRQGCGYLCSFKRASNTRFYEACELDLCAAYVIPEKIWYIIPARHVVGEDRKTSLILGQFRESRAEPKYEDYREAWMLLRNTRRQLSHM